MAAIRNANVALWAGFVAGLVTWALFDWALLRIFPVYDDASILSYQDWPGGRGLANYPLGLLIGGTVGMPFGLLFLTIRHFLPNARIISALVFAALVGVIMDIPYLAALARAHEADSAGNEAPTGLMHQGVLLITVAVSCALVFTVSSSKLEARYLKSGGRTGKNGEIVLLSVLALATLIGLALFWLVIIVAIVLLLFAVDGIPFSDPPLEFL